MSHSPRSRRVHGAPTRAPLLVALLVGGLVRCAPESTGKDGSDVLAGAGGTGALPDGGSGAVAGAGSGAAASGSGGDPGIFVPGSGGAGAGGGGADADCTGVESRAEKRVGGKADIVFVLDNSGSMTEEAIAVQANMNSFSQLIRGSGIDANVVVISSGPPAGQVGCAPFDFVCWANLGGGSNGVCIDPPLGLAGACPNGDDTNFAAGYMHWREEVGSHDALGKIQSTYDGWRSMLRADSAKTFVVVTDDEADPAPDAAAFTAWANSQPEIQGALWRFSGVFCVTDGANCANIGATFATLVSQTGGIQGDLAQFSAGNVDAQFSSVFSSLANAVIADAVPVECEWVIPPPPEGEELDPALVNVRFTRGSGSVEPLYGVETAACPPAGGFLAWHYDDPKSPTRVIACPETCPVLQADEGAAISVAFGCATEPPPIE